MPDLSTTSIFVLEFDGVELASFRKCSGIESEVAVTEYQETTKQGRVIIRKVPGTAKWSDITLESRIDGSRELWEWHKQVIDGDIDGARRSGSIVVKNSKHEEVARWNFDFGWPSKWTGADFDASSNDIATQKIVITHEGLVRG
jgi:phage tail-like protein